MEKTEVTNDGIDEKVTSKKKKKKKKKSQDE